MSKPQGGGSFFETIARFVVDRRNLIFFLYIVAAIFSVISSHWVAVDNDITDYLSKDTETRKGLTLMDDEMTTFGTARIMVSHVTYDIAYDLAGQIEGIDGVSSAKLGDNDPADPPDEDDDDDEPDTPEDIADYMQGANALITVTFDGEEDDDSAKAAMQDIRTLLSGYDTYISTTVGVSQADTLAQQMTVILGIAAVIIVLVLNLRASIVIASMLPIAVLATFIIMRYTGIAANIVALSGIAIAIGVMVDVGVVFVESIIRYREMPENRHIQGGKAFVNLIYKAVSEVSGAISTAMITTIVSFLPVFTMEAQEGKMFSPLAYTKTYALASAFVLGLILLPSLSYWLFSIKIHSRQIRKILNYLLIVAGIALLIIYGSIPAIGLTAVGLNNLLSGYWKKPQMSTYINIGITLFVTIYYLSEEWLPMGPQKGMLANILFVAGCVAIILSILWLLVIYYERILRWCLDNRWKFMLIPGATIVFGFWIWRGIGQEFMPSRIEGPFLLMPTSMPHSGIDQNLD